MGGTLNSSNATFIGGNIWHHAQGRPIAYYESTERNYYRGGNPNDTSFPRHIWRNRDDNSVMSLLHSGELRASAFTVLSDIRIKKEIEDFDDTIGLEKILLTESKTYQYIDEEKGTDTIIGFIAQQIRDVISEAVHLGEGTLPSGDTIEDFHYLDKNYIYTLNVCATQELHRMIIRQQAVIDNLISRIQVLES